MALTVQDDTGLIDDANSYCTYDEFVSYWSDRGYDYSETDEDDVNAALVKGWQYTDYRFKYKGTRLNGRTQTTEFPREDLYDLEGDEISDIPFEVQNAQMEYAQRELVGTTLQSDGSSDGSIKSERKKIDVIEKEIEYYGSGQDGDVISYPTADNKIPKYFLVNNGVFNLLNNHA